MDSRPTEQRHPQADGLHLRPAAQIGALFVQAQSDAIQSLSAAFPAIEAAAEVAAAALRRGGRLGYAGAGSSGLMALADALELAGTFGIPPDRTPILFAGGLSALSHMPGDVEDDTSAGAEDFRRSGLSNGDVLIVVSASGSTPYSLAVADAAKAVGVTVVGLANVAPSPLLQQADIAMHLATAAELVAGSTRLGAATAQKAALNLVSVLVGIALGHVHDGYMVNVQADNAKLVGRAARIVAGVARVDEDTARAALARSEGGVKRAILVAQGRTPHDAEQALRQSGGHLAPLLQKA
ncbi:N-acetylmuramic acid 6-phosphate etherase [Paracoccus benzoatiresistens]|uniref:N-acetylmuramic acid 6-phosphate etherase n=1 Tax=Paracoccus benzoatiresistens TaxID=2997341 RepID=A0ABT4J6N6_9RHOB|nr:N-acetylmuramic acid 6-phosphate etherase [Paracoccus sp. EF6]MCZ0962330.1 N-acetylmuramic acid 6-phosphate etherase [Paracoccus sp. EF6]